MLHYISAEEKRRERRRMNEGDVKVRACPLRLEKAMRTGLGCKKGYSSEAKGDGICAR